MRTAKAKSMKLTILDPYPVVPEIQQRQPYLGPFYSPGSSWYYPLEHRAHAELVLAGVRACGYRATLEEVL